MPLDENNDLISHRPQSLTTDDISHNAPPGYGDHTLDQLYSEVDPTGYLTPMNTSGGNTPFYAQSGATSEENLRSIDASATDNLSASILHHRLNNIQNSNSSRLARDRAQNIESHTPAQESSEAGLEIETRPHRQNAARHVRSANVRGSQTPRSHSNSLSRRGSDEDYSSSGAQTPQHIELNTDDLSRVPSYGTALKTPLRGHVSENLPNYQTAISRPPSPSHSRQVHRARHFHDDVARTTTLPVRPSIVS